MFIFRTFYLKNWKIKKKFIEKSDYFTSIDDE